MSASSSAWSAPRLSISGARPQRQREEIEAERARILNDARAQARREVEAVQAELARLRKQARNPNLSEERLASLRERARRLEEPHDSYSDACSQASRRAGG